MCKFKMITKYICGHEEIDKDEQISPYCIYGDQPCAGDIGALRMIDITTSGYCAKCSRLKEHLWPGSQFMPRLGYYEKERQQAQRRQLNQAALIPEAPRFQRVIWLNQIARATLSQYLAESDHIFNPLNFMWMVMYVASLPNWLDRRALVSELEPWFASFFDEDMLFTLRPPLKSMLCEDKLNDIMVWKNSGETIYL